MHQKHKFFITGATFGFIIPLVEYGLSNSTLYVTSKFVQALVLGGEIWHYIFLFLVVINALLLYVRKFRERINPDSRIVFLISGVALGFSVLSIISMTVQFFT